MSEKENNEGEDGVDKIIAKRNYPTTNWTIKGEIDATKDTSLEKVRKLFMEGKSSWNPEDDAILLKMSSKETVAQLCKHFDVRIRPLMGAYQKILEEMNKQTVFIPTNEKRKPYTEEEKAYILNGLFSEPVEKYVRTLENSPNKIVFGLYEKAVTPEHRRKQVHKAKREKPYKDNSMKFIEEDFKLKKLNEQHETEKAQWKKELEESTENAKQSLLQKIWTNTTYKELMNLSLTWPINENTLEFIHVLTKIEMQYRKK